MVSIFVAEPIRFKYPNVFSATGESDFLKRKQNEIKRCDCQSCPLLTSSVTWLSSITSGLLTGSRSSSTDGARTFWCRVSPNAGCGYILWTIYIWQMSLMFLKSAWKHHWSVWNEWRVSIRTITDMVKEKHLHGHCVTVVSQINLFLYFVMVLPYHFLNAQFSDLQYKIKKIIKITHKYYADKNI